MKLSRLKDQRYRIHANYALQPGAAILTWANKLSSAPLTRPKLQNKFACRGW